MDCRKNLICYVFHYHIYRDWQEEKFIKPGQIKGRFYNALIQGGEKNDF